MTVTFLTEYNTRCYGVTFQKNGCNKTQKYKEISNHEKNIFCVKPLEMFLGKSKVCAMTLMSGAFEKSVFDGNTILLKISGENDKHRYLYIGGDMMCPFLTNDNLCKYISNMGNNITPYSTAGGHENVYFLTRHFKNFEREKINNNEMLKTNEKSVDPFDFHVSNCGIHSFKKLQIYKIHSNYDK